MNTVDRGRCFSAAARSNFGSRIVVAPASSAACEAYEQAVHVEQRERVQQDVAAAASRSP